MDRKDKDEQCIKKYIMMIECFSRLDKIDICKSYTDKWGKCFNSLINDTTKRWLNKDECSDTKS